LTPINIVIPESLTNQKAELESELAGIASEEEKLATQRKEIQVALQSISTAVAVLSGQPLPTSKAVAAAPARKPMSEDAKKRIAEGLRKAREAKKAAQLVAPASQPSAPPPAEAEVLVSAPQEPAEAPADAPVPDSPRERRASRKAAK